jgi:drug/metabolite transporter (DMT)-like permease
VHPLAFIATTFWLGSIFLVPIYLWETLTVTSMKLTPSTLLVLAYVMIFPSIVSYLCFNRGVEMVGANRAGLFIHLMPVFGGFMAIVFLGEVLGWYHGVGVSLIGLGIYLATRKKKF